MPLQRSEVLEHIWKQDDAWPTSVCRTFILQWANVLESKEVLKKANIAYPAVMMMVFVLYRNYVRLCVQKMPMQTDGWPGLDKSKQSCLDKELDLLQAKAVILNWIKDLRAQPEVGNIHNVYSLYSFK